MVIDTSTQGPPNALCVDWSFSIAQRRPRTITFATTIAVFTMFLPFPLQAHQVHHPHHVHHHHHQQRRAPVMYPALASWFDDAGSTACGTHATNGFAHLPEAGWSCGTRVRFCYGSRCVTGMREDSGPYIEGRTFDLTPSLRNALVCPGLCHLRWRRL